MKYWGKLPMQKIKLPPWLDPPTVIIDSREQLPLVVDEYPTEIACLKTGDYSIKGLEDLFCIERKSLSDLCGSLTSGRKRFMLEIERMENHHFKAILIEADFAEVFNGEYRSRVAPKSIIGTLYALQTRQNVHIIWGGSVPRCSRHLFWMVRMFIRGIEKGEIVLPEGCGK